MCIFNYQMHAVNNLTCALTLYQIICEALTCIAPFVVESLLDNLSIKLSDFTPRTCRQLKQLSGVLITSYKYGKK